MTREIAPVERARISNALDFFEPKTLATLATESGVDVKIVRKYVNAAIERDSVERRGNLYRIKHAAPWGTKNAHVDAPAKSSRRAPMEDT